MCRSRAGTGDTWLTLCCCGEVGVVEKPCFCVNFLIKSKARSGEGAHGSPENGLHVRCPLALVWDQEGHPGSTLLAWLYLVLQGVEDEG